METILIDDDGLQEIEIGAAQCALGTLIAIVCTWKPSALRTLDAALGQKIELRDTRALVLVQYARSPRVIEQGDLYVRDHYETALTLQSARSAESGWHLKISYAGDLIYVNRISGASRRVCTGVKVEKP